jgi:SAM-dependent methyltransferase
MTPNSNNHNSDTYSYIIGPVVVSETEDGLSSMWNGGELAEKYKNFAAKLPSDLPAYNALAYLVEQILTGKLSREGRSIEEATILDFGCYDGSSTLMYERVGSKVIGVDKNPEVIEEASNNFSSLNNFTFIAVEEGSQIPLPESSVDIAVLTFVHPTIDTVQGLFLTLEKIHRVLRAGGVVILLGLNPDSFDPNLQFVSYGHNKIDQPIPADGDKFTNRLILKDGSVLEFPDTFWKNVTLQYALEANGFINTKFFPLRETLQGPVGDSLRKALRERPDLRGLDEWGTKGLHQLITAAKPNGNNNYLPESYEG